MTNFTPTEMMTIAAARALSNDDVCFVGIGAPSAACNVARLTHAPDITLIYESGTIGTAPEVLPLSIGDGELCETALCTVSVPPTLTHNSRISAPNDSARWNSPSLFASNMISGCRLPSPA
jgi:acyl CoA:acetate/3-ketoacid CoA transferase beta subunit